MACTLPLSQHNPTANYKIENELLLPSPRITVLPDCQLQDGENLNSADSFQSFY
jgi:hypothetical protein